MTDAFAEIDRAAARPRRAGSAWAWTEDEKEIVNYGMGKVNQKTLLTILNTANEQSGRAPRTLRALERFVAKHRSTRNPQEPNQEGNEP